MSYAAEDRTAGHEWIAVAVSSDDRRGADSADVSDTAAFTLEGGYDLLTTEHVRAGLEIGVVWSSHDARKLTGTDEDPRLYVTRWNLGGRLAFEFERVVLYGDGGVYVRSESSDDEPTLEQDGRGGYIGGGIDFWYEENARLGPFVRAYDFADSDLNELLIGISATFAF
ncbi:MAG TPA: hypothetical protein VM509_14785 [Planctomycetota bacterium]|nr:hypothetical protein [Planctomycetota bacterium]